ncbi:putative DNA binding domain-containing protein [Candidatus Woesearchaeota archaeon]|nr:putative DNA binding domain-containing protein [Candidatus Woesearchaeota archaeon]
MTDKIALDALYNLSGEKLVKYAEGEIFDRTISSQDNIGVRIAAFGTKNGGIILVGQKDFREGGEIIGIDEEEFQRTFSQAISNVRPAPLTQSRIIEYKDKKLAVIEVRDVGELRPCAYKKNFYERKGESSLPLQPDEVRRYHIVYGGVNIENMPTHASREDIDKEELKKYSELLKKEESNILESISHDGSLTIRGVVALSRDPLKHLEGAFIEIQKYDNVLGSPPIPIGSPIKLSKPAGLLIEETTQILLQNLPLERKYDGAKMVESPIIPVSVIREVITNAVAHRNYRSTEHVRIRIFADCFDIANPAVVSEKMWADILATHSTYHPNEGLYTFLNPKQLYEGRGEGIWKIKEELERLRKIEPEFKVIGDSPSSFYVKINLTQKIAKDVKMLRLTAMIKKNEKITSSKVMKLLGVSRVTALNMLNKLVKEGILDHEGTTKTSKYKLKKIISSQ